jgi:SAM-dependent methyltransferase
MDYNKKFKNRVEGYMYAAKKYDKVLENENIIAIRHLNPSGGEKILHIGAVGVDFKKYILNLDEIELVEIEQNKEFAEYGGVPHIILDDMPYEDGVFDKVIVVASFHHFNELERLKVYKEIRRVLKVGGKFILADVMKNSLQDKFLNGFVNKYNPNGHDGLFFSYSDIKLFETVGFATQIKNEYYSWDFESKTELEDFCFHFFNLLNLEKDKIYEEVKKYLVVYNFGIKIKWNWRLIYFIATKN